MSVLFFLNVFSLLLSCIHNSDIFHLDHIFRFKTLNLFLFFNEVINCH